MLSIAPVFLRTIFRKLPPITYKCTCLLMNSPEAAQTLRRSNRIATKALLAKSGRFYSSDQMVIVKHDPDAGHFFIDIKGFDRAYLEYERDGDLIKLTNTQVPAELEGRGLGKILAKTALEYVAKNDLQMEVECDFVRHFINKYEPKYIKYLRE